MTVKATIDNTLLLCRVHIEDARDLLLEELEDEVIDRENLWIVGALLREALDFVQAAEELRQADS